MTVRWADITNDFSAGVFWGDGHPTGGTLTALLQPHFDAVGAEHMVVATNHRLTDLWGADQNKPTGKVMTVNIKSYRIIRNKQDRKNIIMDK